MDTGFDAFNSLPTNVTTIGQTLISLRLFAPAQSSVQHVAATRNNSSDSVSFRDVVTSYIVGFVLLAIAGVIILFIGLYFG